MNYDVVVVGAGIAGSILSKILAEGGFKVALLEKKKKSHIGYPWEITVEKRIFERICLKVPDIHQMPESPDFYRFYSHNRNDYLEMNAQDDSIYYFFHKKFNQRLLGMALKRGIDFYENSHVKELILKDNQVCGIRGEQKNLLLTRKFKLNGKIVVDATGSDQVLCKQTPDEFLMQINARKEDWVSAWQEVQLVASDKAKECEKELNILPGIAYVQVGKYHAFQVLFYRKNNTLNLVFSSTPGKHNPSARKQCMDFVHTYPFLVKRLYGGGRKFIIRRSLDTMAGNGFICLGDAAHQIVPTTGSGVASALYAADIAGRVIAGAINSDDFSIEKLWEYNYNYQTKRGAILASYDIIRLFMQGLTYQEIKSIFDSHFLKESNFITLYSANKIVYNIQQIFELLSTFISHMELIPIGVQIVQAIRDSQRILRLYQNYPRIYNKERFLAWQENVNNIFLRYYPDTSE
ncbi:MAG: NAD(P)/FAD-dependent oxidoreductase [Spirochaetales bacterium]|nr:NAD(P)/FAD-dependent oxidoreductase [Spirochaetales bacterium]